MVYSRDNEDEVIERLIAERPGICKVCVDIGAKDLENNNVANLVINKGWRGVLIERGTKGYQTLYRKFANYGICLVCARATPDNVNDLLPPEFGVLSIDIDGQDYYVWQAIKAKPDIVIIEYNAKKLDDNVVPRNDKYEWKKIKDYKGFGASLDAMLRLGTKKGYRMVEKNADNIFFVREPLD